MKKAKRILRIIGRVAEPADITEEKEHLMAFAKKGFDLVIGVGFSMHDAVKSAAERYPHINFAIIDTVVDLPNVASLVFREEEGSFLAGVVATYVTKTNTIGFVGGMNIPLIHKFELGYIQGAKYINKNIKILVSYAGSDPSAWSDPVKGKALALALHSQGADVIYHAAGSTGIGVIKAAAENGFYAIGVDRDQDDIAKGYVLTSMVKRVNEAVYQIIKDLYKDKFKPGIKSYGLKEGGIGLTDFKYTRNKLPPALFIKLEEIKRDIINKKIVINSIKK